MTAYRAPSISSDFALANAAFCPITGLAHRNARKLHQTHARQAPVAIKKGLSDHSGRPFSLWIQSCLHTL
ncbi:hypothetical protein, partial [Comamonas guangdongensis]